MNRIMAGVASVGAGAATMYLLDPDRGGRRRAILRDKLARGARRSADGLGTASRDLAQRTTGIVAETRARLTEQTVPDTTLEARVRSTLGRRSSHPRAIEVTARDGTVTLGGLILGDEADAVTRAVGDVRGVKEVVDELERHDRTENIPALQGGTAPAGDPWLQRNWSPGTRLVAAGAGLALMGYCASRRDAPTGLLGTAGFALLLRAVANGDFTNLLEARLPDA